MKKFLAMLMIMVLACCVMTACSKSDEETTETATQAPEATEAATETATQAPEATEAATETATQAPEDTAAVMTYEEYMAAAVESIVTVETYVQAKQGWWDNKATVYTQTEEGAYFLYNMVCSEEDYAKLVPGTKIRVTGAKAEWAGEVEIMEPTFEIIEGETWVAEALDATALLGTDELINHQNKLVSFKGMTVEASKDGEGNEVAFLYNWDGSGNADSDSDLYFNASVNGNTYTFVIEYYLCGPDTDAYKAVTALNIGDTIDMTGFLYWYEGVQPHITSVTEAE